MRYCWGPVHHDTIVQVNLKEIFESIRQGSSVSPGKELAKPSSRDVMRKDMARLYVQLW